uniref:HpcH/HpaI aldolase/citrate lyase family protein n=1 Tax=Halomonas sp. TaxID=1486246 RepID=UPI0026264658|nr:CoA ester lyase [Halomonas sp.]
MNSPLQRSFLFVPATRPERIAKALNSDADTVIVDLEDAVAPHEKDLARHHLDEFLQATPEARVLVRINSTAQDIRKDLAVCARFSNVCGIMLPKAETCKQIELVAASRKPVWPIIETARGLVSMTSLAFTSGIERLTFGALDLSTDLNLEPGSPGAAIILDQCRYQLIVCSRSARLPPPVESVAPHIHDTAKVEQAAQKAAEMGFSGMLSIHPKQLPAIHKAFTPSSESLAWARKVLDTAQRHDGAFQLDGQMIDEPVIIRARTLLARAGE